MPASVLDDAALAATLVTVDPTSTIRPAMRAAGLDSTIADTAPRAPGAELQPLGRGLVLGSTIGEGGMAIVRVATQASLGREVAVKTLRPDATDDAGARMLREAWITGALEHPNIVPVHDLGTDERGRPLLVLKRIEGRPWADLIGERTLEWNLQTLVHVCNALAFAHSRGVLHRDLKPSNVMIGGFGEVYVLDWGIAVSLVDDGSGRLPLAADCREIGGTLAYMAPEMLGTAPLTVRTDVYLLGAVLHEIATGRAPHVRESVTAALESIRRSEPSLGSDVPVELASIIRRALSAEPAGRHASVDELRAEIAGFLEHRGSAEIAREALQQLAELETHLARPLDENRAGDSRVRTHQLFGEIRFGLQAALRAWPGNAVARDGLDRTLAKMAHHEIDLGELGAAAILAADMQTPDPALAERIAAAEAAAADKAARIARAEQDQDVQYGSLARALFIGLFAVSWALMPIIASLMPSIDFDHPAGVAATTASIVITVALMVFGRRMFMVTALNRNLVLAVLLSLIMHDAVELLTWALGVDMLTTHMISIGQWAGICAICAVFIDRAMVLPSIGFLVTLGVTIAMPGKHLWAISIGLGALLAVVLYVWKMQARGRRIAGLSELLRRAAG